MLYGIGCDLCEVARMEKSLSGAHGPAFVRRVFGPAEQAALGLGPAIFGAILLHALQNHHGDYTQAVNVFLMVETAMMVVLALATLRIRHRLCLPVVKVCQATK